jgi:hypothetical protein
MMSAQPNRAVNAATALSSAPPAGPLAPGVDVSDPDSLFQFFQFQMQRTQGLLSSEMQAQEDRIHRIDQIHRTMVAFDDFKGTIAPGSPGWDDVASKLDQAKALFGPDSEEAKGIDALIERAKPQYGAPEHYAWTQGMKADEAARRHGVAPKKEADGSYTVTPLNNNPTPIDASDLKKISEQLKSKADSLNSESSLAMIRVQQYVEQSSQIVSHCSNVMKKMHEMNMAAIENIR